MLLPGLSKACATHEASAGFGAARLRAMRNPSASAAPDVERVQSVEMDVLSGDGTVAIDEFVRARAETIRYHETLYRSTSRGTRGSWLAHPHPLVMDSLGLVTHPVHAYDLGAGVGRHTLPIVAGLPTGSRVTAVDIIPSAWRASSRTPLRPACPIASRPSTPTLSRGRSLPTMPGSSSPSAPWSTSAPSTHFAPSSSGAAAQPSLAAST